MSLEQVAHRVVVRSGSFAQRVGDIGDAIDRVVGVGRAVAVAVLFGQPVADRVVGIGRHQAPPSHPPG